MADIDFTKDTQMGRARLALLRRLIDTVALPASAIAPQERALAGDILLDMMFHTDDQARRLCAERLVDTVEAPRRLMRYLAQCTITIARLLLEENTSYNESDLVDIIKSTTIEHRIVIASRRQVSVMEVEALIEFEEPQVIRDLLNNSGARISEVAMDRIVMLSRDLDDLCSLLVQREELAPAQAMAMFWWSDGPSRKTILTKYAADRKMLIDRCSDVFEIMNDENWTDPVARKAIQTIERRQRNRAAIERSEYASLEEAIDVAASSGMSPSLVSEIGYIAGMKPISVAKVISDLGGEGLAVLCKATGLKRHHLRALWRSLRRPEMLDDGVEHPQLSYVVEIYDTLSVAKAQTVLRYWNWSLTGTGLSGDNAISEEDEVAEELFSTMKRTASLVFGT
ncbi:MAG: DUF2336 domain-containing protein [Pseudomonadota bacterium]